MSQESPRTFTREFDYEYSRTADQEQDHECKKGSGRIVNSEDLLPSHHVHQEEVPFVERCREFDYEVKRPVDVEHSGRMNKGGRLIDPDDMLPSAQNTYEVTRHHGEEGQYQSRPTECHNEVPFVERTREFDYEVTRPVDVEHSGRMNKYAGRLIDSDDMLPSAQHTYEATRHHGEEGQYQSRPTECHDEVPFVERCREFDYEVTRPVDVEHSGRMNKYAGRLIDPDDMLPSKAEEYKGHVENTVYRSNYAEEVPKSSFDHECPQTFTREFDYEYTRPTHPKEREAVKKGGRLINPDDM